MPPVAKACLERFRKVGGYSVYLVDFGNVDSFIDMSDIIPLYEEECVPIQTLSDIGRIRLLRKYGGFYFDATILLSDLSFPNYVRDNFRFYSQRFKTKNPASVSRGRVSTFFWATYPENPFFSSLDDIFTSFLLKHHGIIDYFQFDFIIELIYRNSAPIRKEIDLIPPNNSHVFVLQFIKNMKFRRLIYNVLIRNTSFFKLSAGDNPNTNPGTFFNTMAGM